MNTKTMILLIVILLLYVDAKAQELKYGIMAGVNLVSISLSNVSGNGFKYDSYSNITYNINGTVEFRSDSWWGISLEPGFMKKGGTSDLSYANGSDRFSSQNSRTYSNIDLPVLLNIDLNKKFYISGGIGLDYTISSSKNNENRSIGYNCIPADATSNSYKNTLQITEILPSLNNKLSCSAIVGASYRLSNTYDICLRYGLGLTKLSTVNVKDNINNSAYFNYIQLALKYNIN